MSQIKIILLFRCVAISISRTKCFVLLFTDSQQHESLLSSWKCKKGGWGWRVGMRGIGNPSGQWDLGRKQTRKWVSKVRNLCTWWSHLQVLGSEPMHTENILKVDGTFRNAYICKIVYIIAASFKIRTSPTVAIWYSYRKYRGDCRSGVGVTLGCCVLMS